MILEAKKLVGIILLLTIISCGSRKKNVSKISKITEVSNTVVTNTDYSKIVTDSSTTLLNIVLLNIVAKDSTQPIKIIDSEGRITTFVNVKSISSTTDRSVIKNAVKKSEVATINNTVGTTITVDENVLNKETTKIDTGWIYLVAGIIAIIILQRIAKKFLFPL
jgi:ribosomal silencing factor RsfS